MLADRWARRYGRRPCEFLRPGERDEEIDVALDIACMHAGSAEDAREAARGGGVMFVREV